MDDKLTPYGETMSNGTYKEDDDLVPLHSVGCVLDTKLGMSYPMYEDGTHDESGGCHLEDIEDEWYETLSPEDLSVVLDYTQRENN